MKRTKKKKKRKKRTMQMSKFSDGTLTFNTHVEDTRIDDFEALSSSEAG